MGGHFSVPTNGKLAKTAAGDDIIDYLELMKDRGNRQFTVYRVYTPFDYVPDHKYYYISGYCWSRDDEGRITYNRGAPDNIVNQFENVNCFDVVEFLKQATTGTEYVVHDQCKN